MIRLFLEFRGLLEKEMSRIYIKEEIKEVVPNPKLNGRVIMKADSHHIDIHDVPFEHLTPEDQAHLKRKQQQMTNI